MPRPKTQLFRPWAKCDAHLLGAALLNLDGAAGAARSQGVLMAAPKKVFGILRKFARGSHAVYAGSFQTFESPAPAVGFLYLLSQFCIRRIGARLATYCGQSTSNCHKQQKKQVSVIIEARNRAA
jgi:hypothetical protein